MPVGRPSLSPHFQLMLDRHGALDSVRLEVEADLGVAPADCARLSSDAAQQVKSIIGVTAEVQVQPAGSVPRSQGKAVRVRDMRARAG